MSSKPEKRETFSSWSEQEGNLSKWNSRLILSISKAWFFFSSLPLFLLSRADNCQLRWECYSYVDAVTITATQNLFNLSIKIQKNKEQKGWIFAARFYRLKGLVSKIEALFHCYNIQRVTCAIAFSLCTHFFKLTCQVLHIYVWAFSTDQRMFLAISDHHRIFYNQKFQHWLAQGWLWELLIVSTDL